MIRELSGNLLTDDADALVNTVNTVGAMGKGIALQFKRAFPQMYREYEADARAGRLAPGRVQVWANDALTGPRYIINFPTKRHWRSPSRMDDIESGLLDLARVLRELGVTSVAIPPLGCGNGGLAWEDVAPRISAALASLEGVDVRVYPPAGAPPARDMVHRTSAPPLTASRAALLALMVAYRDLTWTWPTHIDVQKLAYFLQATGRDLRLEFNKGHYGPYADSLRRTLSEMEGHQILGFGDGSAPALAGEPIEVTLQTQDLLQPILLADEGLAGEVAGVVSLAEGFTSTYGMELLASVHWAAAHGASTPAEAMDVVRRWTRRKASLFGEEHVRVAWSALAVRGWLPETCAETVAS